jgi:hypothetical protein
MLIVETLDASKKRVPVHATDQVVALSDISIYTDDDQETALANVFESLKTLQEGKPVAFSPKKASQTEIQDFFAKVLPNYDRDRVHTSDMRKVFAWYNLLVEADLTDFSLEEQSSEEEAEAAES